MTLIDHKRKAAKEKPTIDEVAFPDMDGGRLTYWSSTTDSDAEGAWIVFFGDGSAFYISRRITEPVRLVRGGQ